MTSSGIYEYLEFIGKKEKLKTYTHRNARGIKCSRNLWEI